MDTYCREWIAIAGGGPRLQENAGTGPERADSATINAPRPLRNGQAPPESHRHTPVTLILSAFWRANRLTVEKVVD